MEEREKEKKLLVPRIRFGSFELLNIDVETLFSTFLCRETRDEFLRIFFFFFSPFLRLIESSTSLFDTMLSTKLFITLSFITLLPFPFSWNVNRSKCKPFRTKEEACEGTEIKERYLENFPFVNVSTDCRKTFSNFTLEETTNDASFSHVGLPPCRLLLLHLISIDRAIPRHVLREEITNDENIALIIPIITIIEKTVNSNRETKKKQTNAIFTLTEPHASLNVYPPDFARVSANLKSYFKIIARNECGRE